MSTRIFVQVWCEVDPTLNLRVDRQTGAPIVDDGDLLMRISPLGRAAIAEALKIGNADVTAFAIGSRNEDALRHALAAGASRAVQLQPECDALSVTMFANWLSEQKPDLVIADSIAGRVAARLGWAHLAGIDQLRIESGKLRAIRHLGRGDCESVTALLPAVVRLQTESPGVRYISRARLAKIANLPIEQVTLNRSSSGSNTVEIGGLQLTRPRTRLGAAPAAAPAKAMDRLNALMGLGGGTKAAAPKAPEPTTKTPEQMAEEFVRYLAHHNLLDDL